MQVALFLLLGLFRWLWIGWLGRLTRAPRDHVQVGQRIENEQHGHGWYGKEVQEPVQNAAKLLKQGPCVKCHTNSLCQIITPTYTGNAECLQPVGDRERVALFENLIYFTVYSFKPLP